MQISITDGVDLILIPTQQFKTNRIVVSFMTELADVPNPAPYIFDSSSAVLL